MKALLVLFLLAGFAMPSAYAAGKTATLPLVLGGIGFFNGKTGKSFTGSNEYFLVFGAEEKTGNLRYNVGMDFEYSSGTASVGTDTPKYSLFGAGLLPGFHIFPFSDGKFQPFLGLHGVGAWHYMSMAAPPTGVEPNTQSFSFGYQISAGVDIRPGGGGRALRVMSALSSVSSTLAGVSGMDLFAFRFALGIVY